MKKSYAFMLMLSLVLSFHSRNVHGQKIHFADTSNAWRTLTVVAPNGPPGFRIDNKYHFLDTVVEWNNRSYSLLEGNNGLTTLVREDTITGKIYIKPLNWAATPLIITDTGEFLYMDFGMNVGDTLRIPIVSPNNGNDSFCLHVVNEVGSTLINNVYHKWLYVVVYNMIDPVFGGAGYRVTEGIGSDYGPIVFPYGISEWMPNLICFKTQGAVPSIFFEGCFDDVIVSTGKELNKDVRIDVFPNPTNEMVSIKTSGFSEEAYSITLSDIVGRTHLRVSSRQNETNIDLKSLPEGIYFLRVFNKNGFGKTQKLIVAR